MTSKVEYQIVEVAGEEKEKVARNVFMHKNGCVKIIPGNIFLATELLNMHPIIKNFKVRDSDVFVSSYPKAGSTWTQELLWAMLHNPNLDHPLSKGHPYEKAFSFDLPTFLRGFGYPKIFMDILEKRKSENFYELYATFESPRVFKTHMFLDFLPDNAIEKAKFIYVMRNPLDSCLSYYHYSKNVMNLQYPGTLDEFVDAFIEGTIHFGSFLEHLKHWWRLGERKNILTVSYEDMKKDIRGQLKRIDRFMETNLTEPQIDNVIEYCSFEKMKERDPTKNDPTARAALMKNKNVELMYRKGEVGSSDKELTPAQISKLKKFFRENLGDVKLPYDFSD